MLKFLRTNKGLAGIAALCALIIVLTVALAFSFPVQRQQQCSDHATNTQTYKECVEIASAQSLSDYTEMLAVFTAILAVASIAQGILIWRQVSLARDDFLASHRPEIVIHSVEFKRIEVPGRKDGDHEDDPVFRIGALVRYYNKGTNEAIVEDVRAVISSRSIPLSSEVMPRDIPKLPRGGKLPVTIESGIGDWFTVESDYFLHHARAYCDPNARGIFCIGWIWYADRRGAHRQIGFVRSFDPGSERWIPVEGSGYNLSY